MGDMGKNTGLPLRLPKTTEAKLPNLRKSGYKVTSHESPLYNCVAYAAGDMKNKWQNGCAPLPGYYWPPSALQSSLIEGLESAFAAIKYVRCAGYEPEQGYEKIALYADAYGIWTHAAIQRKDGSWSSKLGNSYDIRHKNPHSMIGPEYGYVMCYMSRKKK